MRKISSVGQALRLGAIAGAASPMLMRADTAFDPASLYAGVATVFGAAATVAGGFLAIKFGAKMVKKAWAWLT